MFNTFCTRKGRSCKRNFSTMDAPHRDSSPGSVEVSKRPLPVSAGRSLRAPRRWHPSLPKISSGATPLGQYTLLQWRRYWQDPVLKKAAHRDRHPQTLPLSSLPSSMLRLPPLLLLVPPRFLQCSKNPHRRRVHRDRMSHQIAPNSLLSSTLRCLPLLEKVPPRNPPRSNKNLTRTTSHLTSPMSMAMAPLTR